MFRIGEFSKIAQTPITQLRYYDRIGLFQPRHTDKFTGYRYYDAEQLPDLHRILALKGLGLTLEQIQRLVAEAVSAEEIRGMLSLKKAQLEQELRAQVEQLRHIEARLEQVEQEGNMPMDGVIVREIPAQLYFSYRETFADVRQAIGRRVEMTRLLPSHVSRKKLGYFVSIMHEDAFTLENAEVEMGFLLNDAVSKPFQMSSGHELAMRILPRVEMAACVARVGGFEQGYSCYGNAGRWLATNGYSISGPIREVFIKQVPMERIHELVCEIQIPVTLDRQPSLPLVT